MHFVDNVHLTFTLRRRKTHFITQLTNFINAAIAGCVNLHYIHKAFSVDSFTAFTLITWFTVLQV